MNSDRIVRQVQFGDLILEVLLIETEVEQEAARLLERARARWIAGDLDAAVSLLDQLVARGRKGPLKDLPFWKDLVTGLEEPLLEDGYVRVPEKPGLGVDLNFQTESAEQMMELFGFDELDEVPHVTRRSRINYPSALQRRGVEGYVELLIFIDPSGRVEVREVLSYSHREFIAPAKSGAAATRFSPPMRNGQPVRAQYSWKIEFTMDR